MGYLAAQDMLDMSPDTDMVLSWHLQSNHYPPVPASMVPVCREAIDNANAGDWGASVTLPEGTTWRGFISAPTSAIVDSFHLHVFITEEDD